MEFELSAGLYAAGVQIAAVIVLVYVVVALIGARTLPASTGAKHNAEHTR
jgi:hypothetical protein